MALSSAPRATENQCQIVYLRRFDPRATATGAAEERPPARGCGGRGSGRSRGVKGAGRAVIGRIRGEGWVTAEATLLVDEEDRLGSMAG